MALRGLKRCESVPAMAASLNAGRCTRQALFAIER